MTREQALRAIEIGLEMAKKAVDEGYEVIGVGEMGIGNTTTSSCVLCALTGIDPMDAVGRGGCITDAMFAHKRDVVRQALDVNAPDASDVVGVLAKVGGFDLAAMAGVYLGAALYRIPVVIDGYISAVGALCAYRLCNTVKAFLFPSHCSCEAGYTLAMNEMGLSPYLNLEMRLGEGSGCPLAFSVMETACAVMTHMATFAEAEINDDYLEEVRREME
jgi:nicotinate-nucleotide--dimethylbenzimidazole phosphoribosyltransferase